VIAVVIMIPVMVVFESAVRAIPVAAVEAAAFMARADPVCTGVGRTSPISLMPNVVAVHRIPVAINPRVPGSRADRNHIMPRRGRRPDLDSDRDLGSRMMSAKQEH
jgi:hypothetical protein